MLKKTITYNDFEGVSRTDDFYFNLTRAEITEMDLSYGEGLEAMVNRIVEAKDNRAIIETFKDLIRKSYGEKSIDGKRFMKSEEITNSFTSTEAYSELFMEFLTDAEAGARFIEGVIPKIKDVSPAEKKALEMKIQKQKDLYTSEFEKPVSN